MIRTIRHRGLKRLVDHGDPRWLPGHHRRRIEDILAHIDSARSSRDVDLPGYRLHRLRGDLEGFWSVRVSRNWRIVFRMQDGGTFDVDLIDYH